MVASMKCSINQYSEEHYKKTVEWLNQKDIRDLFGITYAVELAKHKAFVESNPTVEFLPLYCDGDYVGNIVLTNNSRHLSSYLQIYIGDPKFRNKGLGEKFMNLALEYVFGTKKYHRIWLHVREHNEVAIKLYEKLGFSSEGLERESIRSGDMFISQIRMSILSSDQGGKK